ncbi:MAG: insulinase family protein [Holosporaceae bacterium]|nr:insulinase family protein [Holosporaceae bacterium]
MINELMACCRFAIFLVCCLALPLANSCRAAPANDDGKKYARLSNVKDLKSNLGIRFLFMRDTSAPLVHVCISFKYAGSAYQEKNKSGLPAFYEKSVSCGSGKYSQVQFQQELNNRMIGMSCYSNEDDFSFSMTAPKIVLNEAAALFNVYLQDPVFEKHKVKCAQEKLSAQLQSYAENPSMAAVKMFLPALIFKSHPYENGVFGTAENITMLSIDDLKKYKSDFLVTSNAEACIFGDLSEEEAKNLLDKIFRNVPRGVPAKDSVPDTDLLLESASKEYYAQSPQSTIVFAMKTMRNHSPQQYVATVLSFILGGGMMKSRIMAQLRTKEGLIYSGHTRIVHMNHASLIIGTLKTDNTNVKKAIESLKKIVTDLRENGISEDDLAFAKSNISGSMLVSLRTSGDLCNFYFAKMQRGFGADALKEALKGINAVTVEDVNTLSKKIMDENNMAFVIIGGNEQ